jgi:hypothetical protein
MSTTKTLRTEHMEIPTELSKCLGVRRTTMLKRIMRQSGLPMEVVLDLALEILDIASRKLAPTPINRQAVGLGTARWRNVGPEERSAALRKAAQARWANRPNSHEDSHRGRKA